MSGFGILMLIFGLCVLLVGIYMFTGHKMGIFSLRPTFKNLSMNEWKNIGKWTMCTSIIIFIIAIVAIVFNV